MHRELNWLFPLPVPIPPREALKTTERFHDSARPIAVPSPRADLHTGRTRRVLPPAPTARSVDLLLLRGWRRANSAAPRPSNRRHRYRRLAAMGISSTTTPRPIHLWQHRSTTRSGHHLPQPVVQHARTVRGSQFQHGDIVGCTSDMGLVGSLFAALLFNSVSAVFTTPHRFSVMTRWDSSDCSPPGLPTRTMPNLCSGVADQRLGQARRRHRRHDSTPLDHRLRNPSMPAVSGRHLRRRRTRSICLLWPGRKRPSPSMSAPNTDSAPKPVPPREAVTGGRVPPGYEVH